MMVQLTADSTEIDCVRRSFTIVYRIILITQLIAAVEKAGVLVSFIAATYKYSFMSIIIQLY